MATIKLSLYSLIIEQAKRVRADFSQWDFSDRETVSRAQYGLGMCEYNRKYSPFTAQGKREMAIIGHLVAMTYRICFLGYTLIAKL